MCINAAKELLYSIKKRVAIYSSQGDFTYEKYIELVDEYVIKLKCVCSERCTKIGILMDDCIELACIFWACIKSEIVPILINNKFTVDTVEKCIESTELNSIIIKHQATINNELVKMNYSLKYNLGNICFWQKEESFVYPEKHLDKSIAFGIFTSGSTNIPKCVLHTHDSMIKCVECYYKKALNISKEDIIYSASKMMHTYGLGNTLFQTVGVRASSIISESGTTYNVISNIQKYRPTVLFAVPSMYREILQISEIYKIDLSSLRMCYSAGERLDLSICEEFKRKFRCQIFDGMGNTEYLTTFITNTPRFHKLGSCGKCIPGFEAVIVDSNNRVLDIGRTGRLLIKGEIHLHKYYNENKIYTANEYFDTENLCYIDQDEYIWFCGRSNGLYKVKGRWINPFEIENLLSKFKEIEDSLVVLDSNSVLNKSILYIKLNDTYAKEVLKNQKQFIHKIKVFLKKRIEHYKCPDIFVIVKIIPKGATGKKIRKLIDKRYYVEEGNNEF